MQKDIKTHIINIILWQVFFLRKHKTSNNIIKRLKKNNKIKNIKAISTNINKILQEIMGTKINIMIFDKIAIITSVNSISTIV